MEFLGLNWSSIIVFLALAVIGVWVAFSFLNKQGLYLFSVVAVLISRWLVPANLFSRPVDIDIIIMPVVFFALLTCLSKFGLEEAKKLFFTVIIAKVALFICIFFAAAYFDSAAMSQVALTWEILGPFVASAVAYALAGALTFLTTTKKVVKNLKKFLVLAIHLAIASAIFVVTYVVFVYSGLASFGNILLIILIDLIIVCLVSLLLGYFEKFLNREVEHHDEEKEETAKEQEIEVKDID